LFAAARLVKFSTSAKKQLLIWTVFSCPPGLRPGEVQRLMNVADPVSDEPQCSALLVAVRLVISAPARTT